MNFCDGTLSKSPIDSPFQPHLPKISSLWRTLADRQKGMRCKMLSFARFVPLLTPTPPTAICNSCFIPTRDDKKHRINCLEACSGTRTACKNGIFQPIFGPFLAKIPRFYVKFCRFGDGTSGSSVPAGRPCGWSVCATAAETGSAECTAGRGTPETRNCRHRPSARIAAAGCDKERPRPGAAP